MPLVTISIAEGFCLGEKRCIADCVHDALVGVGFPETARFQKILRLARDQFIYDRFHPDLQDSRSNRFILIEIILPAEQSREFKEDLLMIVVENLRERVGVRSDDVMVLLMETARDNWAYYGGIQYYSEKLNRCILEGAKKNQDLNTFPRFPGLNSRHPQAACVDPATGTADQARLS